jgi:hypothetical protein
MKRKLIVQEIIEEKKFSFSFFVFFYCVCTQSLSETLEKELRRQKKTFSKFNLLTFHFLKVALSIKLHRFLPRIIAWNGNSATFSGFSIDSEKLQSFIARFMKEVEASHAAAVMSSTMKQWKKASSSSL